MTCRPRLASIVSACAPSLRRAQRGQSSVEYAVVCGALVFALGISMVGDTSVLRELVEAFKLAYERISFAISLPT